MGRPDPEAPTGREMSAAIARVARCASSSKGARLPPSEGSKTRRRNLLWCGWWTGAVSWCAWERSEAAADVGGRADRTRYFGLATSSSSYGGYGGNENSEDRYKYYYDVP